MKKLQKLIIVCGPTATGKSDYAVALAKTVQGEIISADSRQVYKGLDIGSGKITRREMKGVRHHLIDVAHPSRVFSAAQYQRHAQRAIREILARGNTPILCGGTGLYIDAIVYSTAFPAVPPHAALRALLAKEPLATLQQKLLSLDPARFTTIDTQNKVRLIRAIEIATALGGVPAVQRSKQYDVTWHYLDFPDDILRQRIHDRLMKRMKHGMVKEVKGLREKGVSWKRLESLGLEYRFLAHYLQQQLTKEDMLVQLEKAIWQYAKRQRTWFKKYAR